MVASVKHDGVNYAVDPVPQDFDGAWAAALCSLGSTDPSGYVTYYENRVYHCPVGQPQSGRFQRTYQLTDHDAATRYLLGIVKAHAIASSHGQGGMVWWFPVRGAHDLHASYIAAGVAGTASARRPRSFPLIPLSTNPANIPATNGAQMPPKTKAEGIDHNELASALGLDSDTSNEVGAPEYIVPDAGLREEASPPAIRAPHMSGNVVLRDPRKYLAELQK